MYNLFLEYMPGGTLSNAIQAHGGRLDESSIRDYTCQILRGLDYIHLNGLVHCDIKSSNILVGRGGAKIADFGCARRVGKRRAGRGYADVYGAGGGAWRGAGVCQ
ncbi:MITOGEN-ACTIVATED PROTEIN KINASE KINASE KINASE 15 [Salix viminalis]|uniref:MITOGEN-ACTIVATED PROTEIN KINASE KINASE KINASE 15 n=1 Tax=Salix viminalis TaxID=40686 RepID=A0A9Q0UFL6_SALVM|nr:MITOGEN-ACTIVATED PROTEIN KINASE KINASE KINASE 15 [Salix viminalis]